MTIHNQSNVTEQDLSNSIDERSESPLYGPPAAAGFTRARAKARRALAAVTPTSHDKQTGHHMSFSDALSAGAPRPTKYKTCRTCALIRSQTGAEAQALRTILADATWSLQAISDLVEQVSGVAIPKATLYNHIRNHSDGRR